jgi:hypothetical protein
MEIYVWELECCQNSARRGKVMLMVTTTNNAIRVNCEKCVQEWWMSNASYASCESYGNCVSCGNYVEQKDSRAMMKQISTGTWRSILKLLTFEPITSGQLELSAEKPPDQTSM